MNFNKLQSSQSSKYSKKSLVKSSALLLSFLSIFGCATIKHAQEETKPILREKITSESKETQYELFFGHDLLFHRQYYELIENKDIAFFGNQTSLSTIDALIDDPNVTVKKIFTPEHGFNGSANAGEKINDSEYRGIPVIGVYGTGEQRRIPQNKLQDIDKVIFEIQDLDLRYYTYKTSLYLAMDACADANVPLIILDRPNMNGDSIEGPILEAEYQSFVGAGQLPTKLGLTTGEFALLALNEPETMNGSRYKRENESDRYSNIKDLDLTVVPMVNYDPTKSYEEHLLTEKWIGTSPMISSIKSARAYGSGFLDGHAIKEIVPNWKEKELDPFSYIQIPAVKNRGDMIEYLISAKENYDFPGINIEIITDSETNNTNILHFEINDTKQYNATESLLALMYTYNKMFPEANQFNDNNKEWIFKIHGTKDLYNMLSNPNDYSFDQIIERTREGLEEFNEIRNHYKLY